MRAALYIPCLLLLSACEHRMEIGSLIAQNGADDGSDGGGNGGKDASTHDASGSTDGGSASACAASGPAIDVGDGPGVVCSAGRVARAFRFGVCTCDSFQNSALTQIDAFDGAAGAFISGGRGGALGTNGGLYPHALDVTGDVQVAGTDGIPMMANVRIDGDLRDQGQLDGTSLRADIGGNARVGGNVHLNELGLGGTLTVSPTSDVAVSMAMPAFSRAPISIEEPCDCRAPVDVAARVREAATLNDNAMIGLDPGDGLRSLNQPIERTLPCGAYYVDAFYAPNPITLTVTGRVSLFIKGDLVADKSGDIRVQLANDGQLDLFIEGGISTTRLFNLGSSATPGRIRVYAGGPSTLYFAGETTIAGSIYAPNAPLTSSGTFTAFGAVFVKAVSSSAPFTVHYDKTLANDDC